MNRLFLILQIIAGIALMALILIQARGKGFSRPTGGTASFTRRGLEKIVFRFTFVVAAFFIVISFLQLAI